MDDHHRNSIEHADVKVAHATADLHDHPAIRWAGTASEIGDQPPMIAISSATLIAGALLRDRRLARAGARMLAAHALATYAKTLIKNRVDRTRPHVTVEEGRYEMRLGETPTKEMRSFPSGHTAGIVAVTRALARDYPETAPAGAAVAAAVSGIQVPRGAHFVSDVAVGAAIGWAAEAAVSALAKFGMTWMRKAG